MSLGGPLFRWSPPHRVSHVDMVCKFGERFTLRGRPVVMDANQRAVLEDIYAEESPGIPTCFSVGLVGPRQTIGKTTTLGLAALADVVLFDSDLHMWTAHRSFAATAAFRLIRAMIRSDPETQALFKWPPVAGKGQEVLETRDGRRIPFLSRQHASGRSETATKITVDEALFAGADDIGAILPTLVTVPDAQVRYASSGGMAGSEFLRGLRDAGRAGGDPRRAWHEFGVVLRECAQAGCDHIDVEDPGCALNDRELWMQASPSTRATEADILDLRKEMSPAEFAREMLTQWEEPAEGTPAIKKEAWDARGVDPDSPAAKEILEPVAISVECSKDQSMTTVTAAARRGDGKTRVQVVARERGTSWLVPYLVDRAAKRKPLAVVIDPGGPAGFLIKKLQDAKVKVTEIKMRELGQASTDLVTAVKEGNLIHSRQPVLSSAALIVELRDLGEGVVFDRDNDKGDVSPILGAAEALHGLAVPKSTRSGNVW